MGGEDLGRLGDAMIWLALTIAWGTVLVFPTLLWIAAVALTKLAEDPPDKPETF